MRINARDDSSFVFYHYDPSIAAALAAVALFFAITISHCWQAIRLRSGIVIPIIVGGSSKSGDTTHLIKIEVSDVLCLVEVVGYIGRFLSGRESPDWTLGPYIIQAILLLVAPVS